MKRIGAIIVGLACLTAAAHAVAPGYSELNYDLFEGVKVEMNEVKAIQVGYIPANDPNAGKPSQALEWVPIPGGKFNLGTPDFDNTKPILGKDGKPRDYTIQAFDMSKTLVTVEQYAECWVKGGCAKPDSGNYCNWGKVGRELHPVNCVSWKDATDFARFIKGARLPSESEWEYAATSGGKNQKYPWGNEAATCERAVMYGNGGNGCGSGGTMPVLSKDGKECARKLGQTAQGLCDMAGNVWQWVQDKYQSSYADVPTDGSASEVSGSIRVLRGGSFYREVAGFLRADYRGYFDPAYRSGIFGFRLARSSR